MLKEKLKLSILAVGVFAQLCLSIAVLQASSFNARDLITITKPYSEEERGFLHYASHPSTKVAEAFQDTKAEIAISRIEDFDELIQLCESSPIYTRESNFIITFKQDIGALNVSEGHKFGGWFKNTDPSADNFTKLSDVALTVKNILSTLTQEQVQDSTERARMLLDEAYSRRTQERASDFEIQEKSFFSNADIEINATDALYSKNKFYFAQDKAAMDSLLREMPANRHNNYFILGYPNLNGIYSESLIQVFPFLEITAVSDFIHSFGKVQSKGGLVFDINNNLFELGCVLQSGKSGTSISTYGSGNYFAASQIRRVYFENGHEDEIVVSNCHDSRGDLRVNIMGLIYCEGSVNYEAGKGTCNPHSLKIIGVKDIIGIEFNLEEKRVWDVEKDFDAFVNLKEKKLLSSRLFFDLLSNVRFFEMQKLINSLCEYSETSGLLIKEDWSKHQPLIRRSLLGDGN